MKSKGLMFRPEMVRAILEGRKVQTRRIVKPQPPEDCGRLLVETYAPTKVDRDGEEYPGPEIFGVTSEDGAWGLKCPHPTGSEIWVKETWCRKFVDPPGPNGYWDGYWYAATDDVDPTEADGDGGTVINKDGSERSAWRSAMFMPKLAARIFLTVTDVRVQRLQDITDADALAEGVQPLARKDEKTGRLHPIICLTDPLPLKGWGPRQSYASLWESINGKGSWAANSWVLAYTFERKAAS